MKPNEIHCLLNKSRRVWKCLRIQDVSLILPELSFELVRPFEVLETLHSLAEIKVCANEGQSAQQTPLVLCGYKSHPITWMSKQFIERKPKTSKCVFDLLICQNAVLL